MGAGKDSAMEQAYVQVRLAMACAPELRLPTEYLLFCLMRRVSCSTPSLYWAVHASELRNQQHHAVDHPKRPTATLLTMVCAGSCRR
jgi:hypothetical protein